MASLRFDHDIVARTITIWPGLTISRDTGVDQARIDLRQALIVHTVLLQRSWQIVLDKYIRFLCQLVQDFDACRMLERETQRLLISVDLGVV